MTINTPEYSGPYRWEEARERIPNDYRTKDDKPTVYPSKAMTPEELNDFLEEMELDGVTNIF